METVLIGSKKLGTLVATGLVAAVELVHPTGALHPTTDSPRLSQFTNSPLPWVSVQEPFYHVTKAGGTENAPTWLRVELDEAPIIMGQYATRVVSKSRLVSSGVIVPLIVASDFSE